MDRVIPKAERQRQTRIQILKYGGIGVAVIVVLIVLMSSLRSSVARKNLQIGTVDRGTIEATVNASGKVVPGFEEMINSPITTKIVEVYRRAGDSVDVGTPLILLDLQSTQTELDKLADQNLMTQYQLDQQRLTNETYLHNLEMQVKVKEMTVARLEVELKNEKYLDDLGSGTGDKVHQAELAYNTGQLELEQLRQQLVNERKVRDADLQVKQLELSISNKNLEQMRRTLNDAKILSPRRATLTYINNEIGRSISQGEHIATISDLNHFKVEGNIADSYGERIAVGSPTVVKIGRDRLSGQVSNVTPASSNGTIAFTIQLDDDSNRRLRSGLKTDIYVMYDVMDDVMRLPNGSYYVGAGDYELWVVNGNELQKRRVRLGDCNYDYVEVVSGLAPGDQVVTSDMNNYKSAKTLKIK